MQVREIRQQPIYIPLKKDKSLISQQTSVNSTAQCSINDRINFKGDRYISNINRAKDIFYSEIPAYHKEKEEIFDCYLNPLFNSNLKNRYTNFTYAIIRDIPYNGKQLEYANGKKANLYYGDSGYNKSILWIEPASIETLNGVLTNLNLLKNQKQFQSIGKIQISHFIGIDGIPWMRATFQKDYYGKTIYEMELK